MNAIMKSLSYLEVLNNKPLSWVKNYESNLFCYWVEHKLKSGQISASIHHALLSVTHHF